MFHSNSIKSLALAPFLFGAAACTTPGPVYMGQPASHADPIRGRVYQSVTPMNRTVEQRIVPQLAALIDKLMVERRAMRIDGVEVFSGQDKFLPGKIALGAAYVLLGTPRDDPKFEHYLRSYREIADMTAGDTNETWGIYYYILSLHHLQKAGLLERAVRPETLARLREKLDWRHFVRPNDLTLIDLPNNYYGVAFSIARLRNLLGWEDASGGTALLEKTLNHYRTYSGEFGFADETAGEGRFDRYSVLLIGEIAQRFIETGITPPPEVKTWLRKSVDLLLPRLNLRGEGFEYGRSIGAYGETAFLEVLSAAAALDVLTPEEKDAAYAFSSRVTARYADHWQDPRTGSVNLWDGGRRTDTYRGKHRILGENLSLGHQHIYTSNLWSRLGYRDRVSDRALLAVIDRTAEPKLTRFARGEYDRALLTYRDGSRLISVPLVNGAGGQHMHTPYFPIPFSPGMLAGSADAIYPQLIPRITLKDGTVLQPLAFIRDVNFTREGERAILTYRQDALDRMGRNAPVADRRVTVETRYVIEPGRITRTDRFTPTAALDIAKVDMEFATFSDAPALSGTAVQFGQGAVRQFEVTGLDQCRVDDVSGVEVYRTPFGAHQSRVSCESIAPAAQPFTVSWTLRYQ